MYLALAILMLGCTKSYDGELLLIHPEEGDRFQYPYFLFVPTQVSQNPRTWIIVEPNNSGFADDDLKNHRKKAKNTASNDYYLGNFISQSLGCPLHCSRISPGGIPVEDLYPCPGQGCDGPKGQCHLRGSTGSSLKCLKMPEKISRRRTSRQRPNSSSPDSPLQAPFANRFTVMHPDQVLAVAAGGLNGLADAALPTACSRSSCLYPCRHSRPSQEITGRAVSAASYFRTTPQFYFMGALDDNDALPYDDAFDPSEREQISRLLGEQMLPERWNHCQNYL
jgi:hypothetical protein